MVYLIAFFLAVILSGVILYFGYQLAFMIPMFNGPVYVPSADDKLESMLELAKIKKNDTVIDLGAGDGKIVIALAKKGISSVGVEINPLLVKRANKKIEQLGLSSFTHVEQGNFWNYDYGPYSVVFLYGTTYIMKKLEKKLRAELKPGAKVISNFFEFPNWQAKRIKNEVRVYFQEKNALLK